MRCWKKLTDGAKTMTDRIKLAINALAGTKQRRIKMSEAVIDFLKERHIAFEVVDGNVTIPGSLYLSSLTSIPEGFNPTVGGSLDLGILTSIPEGFNPTVGGYLYLSSLTSIPEGFNPTVGGSLDLSSLTSIPEGFNPTVGGYLDLRSLTSIPEGFNPTVGGSLYLSSLTSIPEGFNPTVGGPLDLNSLTSIPEGFNPTVGGSLDLRSLTSIPEGFNPTVGDSLYLSSLTSIPEGFNPTVGGGLYLSSLTGKRPKTKPLPAGFSSNLLASIEARFNLEGFTIADGILAKVISQRGSLKRVVIVGKKEASFLASDDKGNHAHGKTAREAMSELAFKLADTDDLSDLEGMPLDTVKTPHEWSLVYRRVTRACRTGTKHFMEQKGPLKDQYTLAEIIAETKGAYEHKKFAAFFGGGE